MLFLRDERQWPWELRVGETLRRKFYVHDIEIFSSKYCSENIYQVAMYT